MFFTVKCYLRLRKRSGYFSADVVHTVHVTRDVRNVFFNFGSVLRKTAGSVRFQFGFEITVGSVRFSL